MSPKKDSEKTPETLPVLKPGEAYVQYSHFSGFPGVDESRAVVYKQETEIPGMKTFVEEVPLLVIDANRIVATLQDAYDTAKGDYTRFQDIEDQKMIKNMKAVLNALIENIRSESKQETIKTLQLEYQGKELEAKIAELRAKYGVFTSILTQLRFVLVDVLGDQLTRDQRVGELLAQIQSNINNLSGK